MLLVKYKKNQKRKQTSFMKSLVFRKYGPFGTAEGIKYF